MVDCCAPFLMLPILVLVLFKVSPAPGHSFPTLQWAMELYSVSLFSATYYNPLFVCGGIYIWLCSLPQIYLVTFPPKSLTLAENWAQMFTVISSKLKTYKPQRVEYRVSFFFYKETDHHFLRLSILMQEFYVLIPLIKWCLIDISRGGAISMKWIFKN